MDANNKTIKNVYYLGVGLILGFIIVLLLVILNKNIFSSSNSGRKVIQTKLAPAPIGPYSQAITAGNFLFISGQIPLDPTTGQLIDSNIVAETNCVMKNLKNIADAAGYSLDNVVKTTIFLSEMSLFPKVNEVYSSYFSTNFPARETVAVKELPKKARVEISMVLYK